MRWVGRGGAGVVVVVVLLGGLLIATLLVSLSGGTAAVAGTGPCVPASTGALASGAVPAAYVQDVAAAAKDSGLPAPMLAAQLEQESGWNPNAVSPVGARGIAQFMPATWEHYAPGKDPFDPHAGIAAQGRYLGELYKQALAANYPADPVDLAFAAYNAGWGAVQAAGGMPDYPETQNYVIRIRQLSAKYATPGPTATTAATATASPVAVAGGCDVGVDPPGKGDDLPWSKAPIYTASPLGMFNRECVDFALWRVNQQLGSTSAPFKLTNSNFRGDGVLLGSATSPDAQGRPLYSWKTGWEAKGWPTGNTPVVGAVVWYAPGVGGSDPVYGHVAVVKAVNADGTYVEEGYNGNPPPNDHSYYTRTIKDTIPSAFLYVPKPK